MFKNWMLAIVLPLLVGVSTYAQEEEKKDGPRQIGNKWAVKITPTQMIAGELNLGVEFKTSQRTSIEIELGPTISELGVSGNAFWEDEGSAVERTGSIGYFGTVGFRYYPFEKTQALNRLYISPQLKYRVYNTILSEDTGLWGEQTATNTQYKFLFNTGYALWASKSFGFDFYLGAGLGYRDIKDYDPVSVFGSDGIEYKWNADTEATPQILLNAGIKVSIGG